MVQKVKALVARIPVPVREQAVKVGRTFVSAFVGSAMVLVPGVLMAPNFDAQRAAAVALIAASGAAAFRAAVPVAKAGVMALARRYYFV